MPVPTARPSISTGSVLHADLIGKELQQPHNFQSGGDIDEDDKSETDEEDYTQVPSKQDRKAAKVIGILKGACNARHGSPQSTTTEIDGTPISAGNFEYRSLDPDAMEPPHTYHAVRSSSSSAANTTITTGPGDGPQPMYSEPGGVHGHHNQKVSPTKKQRPPPPLKIAPRRAGGNHSKPIPVLVPHHKPVQSVPSVDGEYVDPNDCNSPNNSPNSQNMYQGLTPNKLEYLALYATPDSTPH